MDWQIARLADLIQATKTTAASASPTKSKKNSAGQLRGFAGSVGILLLVGVFAGL